MPTDSSQGARGARRAPSTSTSSSRSVYDVELATNVTAGSCSVRSQSGQQSHGVRTGAPHPTGYDANRGYLPSPTMNGYPQSSSLPYNDPHVFDYMGGGSSLYYYGDIPDTLVPRRDPVRVPPESQRNPPTAPGGQASAAASQQPWPYTSGANDGSYEGVSGQRPASVNTQSSSVQQPRPLPQTQYRPIGDKYGQSSSSSQGRRSDR